MTFIDSESKKVIGISAVNFTREKCIFWNSKFKPSLKIKLTVMPGDLDLDLNAVSHHRSTDYPNCLLNNDGTNKLARVIDFMKLHPEKGRRILKQWLFAKSLEPPLELIWKLNEEEVMFVTTYFYLLQDSIESLYSAFESVYSEVGNSLEKPSACSVLASIVATFVNTLMNPCEEIQTFFKDATKRIVHSGVKMVDEGTMQGCYLSDILNSVYIFHSCLQNFLLMNLKQLLSYPCQSMDLFSVVGSHSKKWTTKYLSVETSHFISKVLSSLPVDAVIAEMKSAANMKPFGWKYFLSVTSILIAECSDSAQVMKSLIDEWLKAGLEDNNKDLLSLAFITARHCCAEKTKTFPTYIAWFGSVQPPSAEHFSRFYSFLTELVPHEPPVYLKIHVNKVPTAPPGCQSVLVDYITLAKTRLADLNLTTDYLSIFNECYDTDEESLSADVSQLLSHFEATNEIAKPVIEASVFRKQYYEKVFLKFLLRVPASEDPVRAQVINKLHTIGKISPAMFTTWMSLS